MMCPLRIVLIFLSATLAGFFACRSFRFAPRYPISGDTDGGGEVKKVSPSVDSSIKLCSSSAIKLAGEGLRVFVSMANGCYLRKALKET